MRLGFRKAGRGRIRGKSDSVKNPSTAPSAASSSGWIDPWPPPCPDEVMSGRGGSGAGGSRCGTAPAGALCCARARGGRGLRASPVTSVAREATTTSAVLLALLTTVEPDTTPTTECGRFGRPETLPASRSRTSPAPDGAAGEAPEFADAVEIGAAAAGAMATATSVSTASAGGDAGILTVVGPATLVTLRVTPWSSPVGACGTSASASARAASISADTSMPAGPAARAVPGPASPLQTIAPAKAHTRASHGRPRPAAPAASKREVSLLFSMLRSVAGDELPEESSRAGAVAGRAHLAGLRSPQVEVLTTLWKAESARAARGARLRPRRRRDFRPRACAWRDSSTP
jgi:hypothetical protein